ncbi:MAG: hypothetical protein J7L96_07190 [Bacteroidales bacterium]|nr:hypothetical protein [Bacteroidales bacterium]
MNGATFYTYLSHPEELDAASLLQLEELISEYPYFQAGQVLYVKNLQNQENIRFNKQLKLAAAYVSNRKVLYELLKVQAKTYVESETVAVHDAEPSVMTIVEPTVEPAAEITRDSHVNTPGQEEGVQSGEKYFELLEDKADETADAKVQEKGKSLLYNKSDYLESLEKFVPIADIDLLLFDFPAGGNADILEFEFENRTPSMESDDPTAEDQMKSGFHTTSFELIRQFLKTDPLQQAPKPRPPHSFIPRDEQVNDKEQLKPETDQEDLVDTFIQKEPRIPRAAEGDRPLHGDISLGSLKDDESFMTETLAGIFVKQGYYYKAMQAFDKLSLKYPEKSIYFATQIEKIKELINNQ